MNNKELKYYRNKIINKFKKNNSINENRIFIKISNDFIKYKIYVPDNGFNNVRLLKYSRKKELNIHEQFLLKYYLDYKLNIDISYTFVYYFNQLIHNYNIKNRYKDIHYIFIIIRNDTKIKEILLNVIFFYMKKSKYDLFIGLKKFINNILYYIFLYNDTLLYDNFYDYDNKLNNICNIIEKNNFTIHKFKNYKRWNYYIKIWIILINYNNIL